MLSLRRRRRSDSNEREQRGAKEKRNNKAIRLTVSAQQTLSDVYVKNFSLRN